MLVRCQSPHVWILPHFSSLVTGLFLYLRPYHNPWIKKAKKLLGCAHDFKLENWILVEWIDKTQTLPKLSLENLGRVCVLSIHSTTFQFSNLKSWAHPYNFFAFLIHGLWFGRSYKNRPVVHTCRYSGLPNKSHMTLILFYAKIPLWRPY